MRKALDFEGIYADEFKEYVKFMKNLDRNFRVETTILKSFCRYLNEISCSEITEEAVMGFVYSKENLASVQYVTRHRIARQFTEYLSLQNKCEPVRKLPMKTVPRIDIVHIYTKAELSLILTEFGKVSNPRCKVNGMTFQTITALLISSGLRISEALSLENDDVDLKNGRIFIRNTKYRKSRYLPLNPDMVRLLKKYEKNRDHRFSRKSETFFVTIENKKIGYYLFESNYHRLIERLDIRNEYGQYARTHDLRHTFAVMKLIEWYDNGCNLNDMLYVLSAYMGHAHIEDTSYYLNAGSELLKKAAEKFKVSDAEEDENE